MSIRYLTLLNIAGFIDHNSISLTLINGLLSDLLICSKLKTGQILWKKCSELKNEILQMWIRQELNVDQIVDESKGSDRVWE